MSRKFGVLSSIFLSCTFSNNLAWSDTVSVQNKFLSYTETGQGKPLVLIHAFPTDKRLWVLQHEGLKNNFRVISLDLWGFGESSPVNGNAVTMSDYADEVKQLLDYLNIETAIIGGESMGGYIALAFLKKYPSHVSGLILSNTQAIEDSPETKAAREKTALDVLENGTDNLINGFIKKAFSPNASEETKTYLAQILSAQKPTAIASALRGMALRVSTEDLLPNIAVPLLIITSDQDVIVSPQQSLDMHALAENSQLVVIPRAGHLSNLEQPDQWNKAVIDTFLAE